MPSFLVTWMSGEFGLNPSHTLCEAVMASPRPCAGVSFVSWTAPISTTPNVVATFTIPGVTHLPEASMRVASEGMVTFAPTETIRPPRMSTVPFSITGPLTGCTRPPVMAIVCAAAVCASATDTSKVANTSATAASTGSDLNGKAAQDAARKIKQRLKPLAARLLGCDEAALVFDGGEVRVDARADGAGDGHLEGLDGPKAIGFKELVAKAYLERIQLWSDGFYATPGLHWDRAKLQGHPFYYYAFGAAVAEVLVDTLTGETRVLRADVLHDVGQSLNPALDIGQVEGAFVQGQGWLTSEELVWHPQSGLLLTHAPSTYKIPTANDMPRDFRVALYDAPNAADSIHRSKAVGEPPLLLPFSVLLAIKDAVAACGPERCDPPLRAPATPEAVLDAIDAVTPAGQ